MAFAGRREAVGMRGSTGANGSKGSLEALPPPARGARQDRRARGRQEARSRASSGWAAATGRSSSRPRRRPRHHTVAPVADAEVHRDLHGQPTSVSWSVDQGALGTDPRRRPAEAWPPTPCGHGRASMLQRVLRLAGGKMPSECRSSSSSTAGSHERAVVQNSPNGSRGGVRSGRVERTRWILNAAHRRRSEASAASAARSPGRGAAPLRSPPRTDAQTQGLKFLYPYDKTAGVAPAACSHRS